MRPDVGTFLRFLQFIQTVTTKEVETKLRTATCGLSQAILDSGASFGNFDDVSLYQSAAVVVVASSSWIFPNHHASAFPTTRGVRLWFGGARAGKGMSGRSRTAFGEMLESPAAKLPFARFVAGAEWRLGQRQVPLILRSFSTILLTSSRR